MGEEPKFLIVTGDFYGIQNFIFSEGGSTGKAASKLLRGRSFSVSLLSELAADLLCREIGLTPISVVLNAAGKFTVIAPNTKEAKDKIMAVEEDINDWLTRLFFGEFSIGITSIEASCNDLVSKHFGDFLDTIGREVERKKYRKVDLERYGGVVKDYLDGFNNELRKKLCPFCGKRPSSGEVEGESILGDEESACKICRDHIYIGTKLVKTSKIAITTVNANLHGDNKLKEPIFGIYQLSMDVTGKLNELAARGELLKYWDISILEDGKIAKYITTRFINGYVPKYREEDNHDERLLAGKKREETMLELIEALQPGKEAPKTFLHIAKKALNFTDKPDKFEGVEALGVLKADVDNLGLIFGYGLKRNSLSRLATLSRQMNYFFSIYLPYLLKTKSDFRDIYTVFAGGDDLFLMGPWNRIIDLASFLRESFRRYVCYNNSITISVGISINKPGEPVSIIAERAEDALKSSKRNNRDSITIFGETVKWKDFDEISKVKEQLEDWFEGHIVNRAMLYRLNRFVHMAKEQRALFEAKEGIEPEDWECLKWKALLRYSLARNVGKELKGEEKGSVLKEVEKVAYWLHEYGGAMKIPLWYILYNKR